MYGKVHGAKLLSRSTVLAFVVILLALSGHSMAQDDDNRRIAPVPSNQRPGIAVSEEENSVLTDEWTIVISEGTDPDALAAQLGFDNLGPVAGLDNIYLFRKSETNTSANIARAATSSLRGSPHVLDFEQQVLRQHSLRPVPTDDLIDYQWHL